MAIAYRHRTTAPLPLPIVPHASAPRIAAAVEEQFVGARVCAQCHVVEAGKWQDSKHAHAMQSASDATVLGNFTGVKFDYHGIVSTFFRRNGKFFVNTDGADGKRADFEISYTFGVYPLQQYLVVRPGGRIQALSIAWDARPKAQGGQRWYHLYPDTKITATDPLHWTGLNQNWNWMCADCHTTKLERNYEPTSNSYATTWAEMNVACEACHGPGAEHVAWAKDAAGQGKKLDRGLLVELEERRNVTWLPNLQTGNAVRSPPLASRRELEVCAQCHSRRSPLAPGMKHDGSFYDTHDMALLGDGLYFDDGQQRDEVYEVGSFLQSRMNAQGVTCSDCHDPHSGALRAPGNAVCAQCHASQKYNTREHTLHAAGSAGAQCAACHMPTRNYMGVDPRRDHSMRIPRPDLSSRLGTPNACNGCHAGRTPAWAAAVIEHAFGPVRKGFQTFGEAFHDVSNNAPGAVAELIALAHDSRQPGIVRATALDELRYYPGSAALSAIDFSLRDPEAMVRGAALDALVGAPPADRARRAVPLMSDPARIVRLKAARALAIVPYDGLAPGLQARLEALFAEYVEAQRANSDRPEAHVNLGVFYTERGDPSRAEAEYRLALALEPNFVPAYVNLADLYRASQREVEGEAVLRGALQKLPGNADLLHALGLARVRAGDITAALALLGQAAQADPANIRYAYVYGVALYDSGDKRSGIGVLKGALTRFPNDRDLLSALLGYARESEDTVEAERYAKRLADLEARRAPPQ